ncbi:extracellular solute-binding protein [Lentibacillus sediminis]|uniref:extracellular solute-binding protein n=1 Tax=Lentibacillus sediminis TaxID=1940529 RepID=UPI000C1BF265|nr:extracellular solute-binding protein [Lentibacillus sediminis]
MFNKKFRLAGMAVFIVVSLVLSACSSSDSSGSADGSSGSGSDEPLQVWGMGAEGERLADFAADFTNETDIQVEVQSIPWDQAKNKLLTAVASGEGPDVIQQPSTWIPEFAESETYLDLTDYFGDEKYPNLKEANFNEQAMESVKIDSKTQAMPWFVAISVLYYRTDLLEDVGYPDGPETQEDFLDAARKLADRGEGQFGMGIAQADFNGMFDFAYRQGWTYDEEKGAESFNDPGFKKMMELYQTMFHEGLTPTQDQGKEPMLALADGTQPMFNSGPFMVDLLNEQVPELEGDWDVKTVPEAENGNVTFGGTQLAVFHNTDKEDKALQFLNFMADPETQVKWFEESNSLPAVSSAWEDPALAENEKLETFREQMEKTQLPPLIPEYERLGGELANTMEKVIRDTQDVDMALEEFIQTAEGILAE